MLLFIKFNSYLKLLVLIIQINYYNNSITKTLKTFFCLELYNALQLQSYNRLDKFYNFKFSLS